MNKPLKFVNGSVLLSESLRISMNFVSAICIEKFEGLTREKKWESANA